MRVTLLGLWVLGIGLASAVGCGGGGQPAAADQQASREDPEEEDAIAIEVGDVGRGTLSAVYSTSATLRADKQATVTARTQGVIQVMRLEEGDWVKKDEPMAVLENDEQRITYSQAKATYDTQQREHKRAESLHAQGLMSEEEYETAKREAIEARHAAELAELTLSRTVIRATFEGRVITRHLDVGATVSDGTAVYEVADLDPLYADVQVPERQVARLQPGQVVRLLTDDAAYSGEAEIERIAPAVDPATGTVKVTLAVEGAGGLRPGSFVRVGIVTDTHDDVLVVPRSALVAEGRRWHVFRIKADEPKLVELIEVQRGYEEGDRVEIVAAEGAEHNLSAGDRLVVTGASSLSDGSRVRVMGESDEDAEELAGETEDGQATQAARRGPRCEDPGVPA